MIIKPANYALIKNALGQSSVFSDLSDGVLNNMLETFRRTSWHQGKMADPETLTNEFYLIVQGRVKVEAIDAQTGKSFTLSILGPGDGFDIISLLDNQPHSVMTSAMENLDLLHAPVHSVQKWISNHPDFNNNFLPYLARRMREIETTTTNLATTDTATRLARLILGHTIDNEGRNGSHPVQLIHDMSHEALAHMLGSTRQVVNKHIQALKQTDVLDEHSRHLKVKNLEALKKKADAFFGHKV